MTKKTILTLSIFTTTLLIASAANAQTWPDLSEPTSESGGGEADAALIVGIGDYVFAPDVEGATANAQDWYVYLTRGRKVPVGNVLLLRDEEGTREQLLEKAAEAAKLVGKGGTLWFVYIGHGAPAKDGKDGVLVGVDAQQSANSLYARSVSRGEVFDLLAKGKQSRTVALLDACFSGKGTGGEPIVAGLQPLLPSTSTRSNAIVLSAGASDQFAGPLPGAKRPAFSYLALGAMRGWGDANGDGHVTASEVRDYATDALRVLLRDRKQTPLVEGPGINGPLVASGGESGPDVSSFVLKPKDPINPPVGGGTGGTPSVTVSTDSADYGTQLGLVRVSLGVSRFGSDTLGLATGDVTVNHGANTIFTDFPLIIDSGSETAAPLGVKASIMLGQDGLGFGGSLALGWISGASIPVRISTVSDSFSEEVTSLVNGVDGTITGFFRVQPTADVMYRLTFAPFAVYAQAGVGAGVNFVTLDFTLDGMANTPSATTYEVVVPLELGFDFNLYKNIFVQANYTFYALPTAADSFQGGVGVYY